MCFFSYGCHPSFFCSTALSLNDASIYRLQWQLLLHLSTMVAIFCQWLVQLLLTIFSCHQQPTIVWQNSAVIFENSHIPHMKSFFAEIWRVDRSLSLESKKIEFALIGLLQLQIFNFEWPKVNIGRMRDLSLKVAISMLFFFYIYIFVVLNFQKGMDVSFLIPLESLHFDF